MAGDRTIAKVKFDRRLSAVMADGEVAFDENLTPILEPRWVYTPNNNLGLAFDLLACLLADNAGGAPKNATVRLSISGQDIDVDVPVGAGGSGEQIVVRATVQLVKLGKSDGQVNIGGFAVDDAGTVTPIVQALTGIDTQGPLRVEVSVIGEDSDVTGTVAIAEMRALGSA